MAGTRASTHPNGDASSQAESNKRKAEDSPGATKAKSQKVEDGQQTIDEAFSKDKSDKGESEQLNGTDGTNGHAKSSDSSKGQTKDAGSTDEVAKASTEPHGVAGLNSVNDKADERTNTPQDDVQPTAPKDQEGQNGNGESQTSVDQEGKEGATNSGAIEQEDAREEALPSSILEKGVIYFFTRGRVGIEDIESVTDLQRSYFVLRPLPDGAKIGDGAMNDLKNNRLIALPKKVWPKSGKDRFMAFVEKAHATNKELKDDFFQGSEYQTQTVGTRQTPPVTPIGEGVYAITSTGNRGETHLVYMLTVPKEPGDLQKDMGISDRGSFVLSLKNPEVKGPANASLPQKPDFPKEFIDDFRGRGWMPVEPKHLDYPNAQMLLIGESFDSGHALDQTKKDENDDKKESPEEELEKLEHEDEIRVNHLKGDDTIFEDLGISKKDYPDVATTW
ncbi:hypothetical protein CAC42_646 [Sphaceloma murrayae]|uniref:BTB domain transcription factor n=1 Tax=Sphaceloma murrayae TaxID=2082308 RepID=A0A2K1QJS9_9PEZI|nr:hypothetical protein CAC42_646 [Sphaceloma murrayae]